MKKPVILIMVLAFVWMAMPASAANCDICGDVNGDGEVNVADLVALVDYFTSWPEVIWPECLNCGNVNCDAAVTWSDVEYFTDWMFHGGPPPCDPDDNGEPDCDPC